MACKNCRMDAYQDNKPTTNDNIEQFNNIISGDQLVLVDFFATWCQPCKMMQPVLEEVKDALGDKINILKIDIDKQSDVAAQYSIQSAPTLMLFRNGEQLWRKSGYITRTEILETAQPLLK